ncbi:patatin-like phospholipase family protein [Limnohabitans sp. Bal53]|uniref:patatin-like phospholipase family protein n=1 Tax=Limnohabitans sp. Bal53 TaxID=1977910 RepID=UPI000D344692|nr:patatin-like phospholipase family protein [Limnohabitans sp. Bal53]PUE42754.1 patatin [Limnohabitans sp. Bal53]
MHIDTLTDAANHPLRSPLNGLVLMGGGARTAYQAGALEAIGRLLGGKASARPFPFQVLTGTSAGALNATFLASKALQGLAGLDDLANFWTQIRTEAVYSLPQTPLDKFSRWATAVGLLRSARTHAAAMDSLALVNTLHQAIALEKIDTALQSGVLQALAVTASSYSSGVHWTFCQTRDGQPIPWSRPGRRAEQQPITIEHLMASSAIPFIFPSTPLWVDGGMEFFGDGSMRQISPLSAAVHLGADRILAIGVGQPPRVGQGAHNPGRPSLGTIAGHAMASVFHDTLEADVEQIGHINQSLQTLPPALRAQLPFRPVQVLALQPSASLDALAQEHAHTLPRPIRRVLEGLGALRGSGAALASYLLFEPDFVNALMALGRADVQARADEIRAFLGENATAAVR